MLNKFCIKNFQSWKKVQLDFHPGLNVIVGLSDAGKSAIIRAMRWVFFNRPTGDEFRSTWGGDTFVSMGLDNILIDRIRTNSFNGYVLNEDSKFEALKTEVPKEIQDILCFSEINLHQQQDNFFLIKESPGVVAQHFNKIANLDKIDLGLQNVQKWINEINKDIVYKKGQVENYNKELLKFDYLKKFESEVEVLEDLEKKRNLEVKNRQELSDLIEDIENIQIEIDEKGKIVEAGWIIEDILIWIDKKNTEIENRNELVQLINTITEKKTEIKELEYILPAGEIIDKLLKLYQDKKIEEDNRWKLEKLIQSIENCKEEIKNEEERYVQLSKQFKKEMGNVCLLCGTKLK